MTSFYQIEDDSFNKRGFPWIERVLKGNTQKEPCPLCGAVQSSVEGDIEVALDPSKGNKWPDVLGCGAIPLFIISTTVLGAWDVNGVGVFPIGGSVTIAGAIPTQLRSTSQPEYVWLDGQNMQGATIDLSASGFVDTKLCSRCGNLSYNVSETYDKQHSSHLSYVLTRDSWNGMNLFTTNLSSSLFFCTDKTFRCARLNRHKNFKFTPVQTEQNPKSE